MTASAGARFWRDPADQVPDPLVPFPVEVYQDDEPEILLLTPDEADALAKQLTEVAAACRQAKLGGC